MSQLLVDIQPYITAISSIFSLSAVGLILKLSQQFKVLYSERIQIINERTKVLEERLEAKDDQIEDREKRIKELTKKLEELNRKITQVGATFGIEEFQKELSPGGGVQISGVGSISDSEFAGRDIVKTMKDLGDKIGESISNIDEVIDKSNKFYNLVTKVEDNVYEFIVDIIFARNHEDFNAQLKDKIDSYQMQGWDFHSISAAYNVFDGCLLIFRKKIKKSF